MGLGTNRTRNWGKDAQIAALNLAMRSHRCAHKVVKGELWLAPSDGRITLPFCSIATLTNVSRGHWEARSVIDGRLLAIGVSERDVIRATIEAVWH